MTNKKNKINYRFFVIMLMSFISLLAINILPGVVDVSNVTGSNIYKIILKVYGSLPYLNINTMLSYIFIVYFYNKYYLKGEKINKPILFLSLLFSIFIVFGYSLHNTNSLDLVFNGKIQFIKSIIRIGGYSLIFYLLLKQSLEAIKKISKKKIKNNKILEYIFEKKPNICIPIILIIAWLPLIVLSFPGIICWDAVTQIYQLLGEYQSVHVELINPNVTLNNHHPILTTLIYGGFIEIGKLLNNVDIGFYLYTLFQTALMIYVIRYSFKILDKMGIKNNIKMIVLLFYAFCPLISVTSVNILKDVLFGIFMFYYVLLLIEILIDEEILKNKKYILKIIITIFFVIMTRNNGIYSIMTSFPLLLFVIKKYKKTILTALLIPLFIYGGLNKIVYPMLEISSGSIKEALSLPFQQTARTLYEGKEYKKEDIEIIEKILDVESISHNYNPTLSDPVKNTYKLSSEKKDLLSYFVVWFKNLFKYPYTYIEAGLNTTFGYWYPNKTEAVGYFTIRNDFKEENPYNMKYLDLFQEERNILYHFYHKVLLKMPVIGLFLSGGIYTWILLTVFVFTLMSKNKKYFIVESGLLILLLVCIASPYFSIRYMYSIIYLSPILICKTIFVYQENNKKKIKNRE